MRALTTFAVYLFAIPVFGGVKYITTNRMFLYSKSCDVTSQSSLPGINLIGLAVVPDGVNVTGVGPGDFIGITEVQNPSGNFDVYRVDGICTGSLTLTLIGETSVAASSITFANGHLYTINGTSVLQQRDLTTFAPIGDPIDLSNNAGDVGGLAFDGSYFYFTSGFTDRLFRWNSNLGELGAERLDPPNPIGFDNSGLELFEGELWGAIAISDTLLVFGTWDRTTGQFTQQSVLAMLPQPSHALGFAAIRCNNLTPDRSDSNCDEIVDLADIQPFVQGILSPTSPAAPPAYLSAGGTHACWVEHNCWSDVNSDGVVDARDVKEFVALLVGP